MDKQLQKLTRFFVSCLVFAYISKTVECKNSITFIKINFELPRDFLSNAGARSNWAKFFY